MPGRRPSVRWTFRILVAAVLAHLPAGVSAQAICSAPHSSPTLARSGAIRTLPSGAGWVQLSLYGQRSSQGFDPFGDRQDFLANASFRVNSVFLTGSVGVREGLEVWLQAPLHSLLVRGDGGTSDAFGLGDLRAAIRIGPALVGKEFPLTVRGGIKVPGSDFPVSAAELPLTDGQVDLEVSAESGWTPFDSPFYAVGWLGYRWRSANQGAGFRPGNERFAHAALGGLHGSFHWELGVDGLWGAAPIESGLELPSAARQLVQLLPTVGVEIGSGQLELTTPVPVSGRNLPAGLGVSLGYRALWGF